MKKINTANWKPFKVRNLFVTHRRMGKLHVPTGASVSKKQLIENGSTPRITVTGVNNGIFGYYDFCGSNQSDYRVYNNFISVSFLGTVFYHAGNASLDMKVHCLKPRNVTLNEHKGLFLVGAIRASLRESSYADQISSSVLPNLEIMLPATKDGEPDFDAMEKYVVEQEKQVVNAVDLLMSARGGGGKRIDTTRWRYYHLYDKHLFTIDSGTKFDKIQMTDYKPSVNFVGRANTNNGVTDFIDRIDGLEPYPAGLLTISLGGEYLGSCFVQDKPFYTSQNVNVLIPRHEMSYYAKKYIAAVIFREGQLHYKAFSDELNRHMKRDFAILLPALKDGSPDFGFMEEFMRNMETIAKEHLSLCSTCA